MLRVRLPSIFTSGGFEEKYSHLTVGTTTLINAYLLAVQLNCINYKNKLIIITKSKVTLENKLTVKSGNVWKQKCTFF